MEGRCRYEFEGRTLSREGEAEGVVVGGNLSILYSLCGSRSMVDTRGKILLIEDLDEYLYHIDRMMQGLKRCGMLEGLAGLVVWLRRWLNTIIQWCLGHHLGIWAMGIWHCLWGWMCIFLLAIRKKVVSLHFKCCLFTHRG